MLGRKETLDVEQRREADDLQRGLKSRHVQLIALGGTIGVGLFLGVGRAISQAGPALVVAYAIVGVVMFFMMRALCELMLHCPVAGSFASYAEQYVSPFAGFATGWSYWLMWILACMAEITAIGIYMHYWFPDLPQWIPALITLVVLYAANLLSVRLFGELEFWFALIKIAAIVALLIIGPLALAFGWGEAGQTAAVSNLWKYGGFFPTGVLGVVFSLQIVVFAFGGIEVLGITAGEVENPEKTLPKAVNAIIWRILLFYIGALLVIMILVPWTQFTATESPFVMVFDRMGLPAAAAIVNFVVITAAASTCNSGIFSTGRLLYALAHFQQAPKAFGKTSRHQVPVIGTSVSAVVMLFGIILNFLIPEQVFVYISSVALIIVLWTWGMIMLAHAGYRRAVLRGEAKAVAFRMSGAPYVNGAIVAFLVLIAVFLGLDERTRIALYVAPVWFGGLVLCYRVSRWRRKRPLKRQSATASQSA